MATDYPIEITDPDGSVRIAGLADFTDPDNQPAQGQGLPPGWSADGSDLDAGGNSIESLGTLGAQSGQFDVELLVGSVLRSPDGATIGFFGQTPAAQPAAPVTLGDVIAALQTLGLVAT